MSLIADNKTKERRYNKNWSRNFLLLVVISAILSGIAYYIQFYIIQTLPNDKYDIKFGLLRMIRMILIYVIPVLVFKHKYKESITELGFLPSKKYPFISLILGIGLYILAGIVFLNYHIFFGGWGTTPWKIVAINLSVIGVMAAVTDFWTRGFILLDLSRRYNDKVAIVCQNITWFTIHLYEILLLVPYISLWGAVSLTLFLGIGGDLIAIKTKSILGLMLGHVVLNLMIILGAKEILIVSLFKI